MLTNLLFFKGHTKPGSTAAPKICGDVSYGQGVREPPGVLKGTLVNNNVDPIIEIRSCMTGFTHLKVKVLIKE